MHQKDAGLEFPEPRQLALELLAIQCPRENETALADIFSQVVDSAREAFFATHPIVVEFTAPKLHQTYLPSDLCSLCGHMGPQRLIQTLRSDVHLPLHNATFWDLLESLRQELHESPGIECQGGDFPQLNLFTRRTQAPHEPAQWISELVLEEEQDNFGSQTAHALRLLATDEERREEDGLPHTLKQEPLFQAE